MPRAHAVPRSCAHVYSIYAKQQIIGNRESKAVLIWFYVVRLPKNASSDLVACFYLVYSLSM